MAGSSAGLCSLSPHPLSRLAHRGNHLLQGASMGAGTHAGVASLFSTLAMAYIPPSTAKSLLMRTPALVQAATSAAVYQAVP